MDETRFFRNVAIVLVLVALIFGFFGPVFSMFSGLGYIGLMFFDFLFSARLVPTLPWVGWAVVGALMGAGLGLWTIAPVLERKNARIAALALPGALIVLLMIGVLANPLPKKRSTAPITGPYPVPETARPATSGTAPAANGPTTGVDPLSPAPVPEQAPGN